MLRVRDTHVIWMSVMWEVWYHLCVSLDVKLAKLSLHPSRIGEQRLLQLPPTAGDLPLGLSLSFHTPSLESSSELWFYFIKSCAAGIFSFKQKSKSFPKYKQNDSDWSLLVRVRTSPDSGFSDQGNEGKSALQRSVHPDSPEACMLDFQTTFIPIKKKEWSDIVQIP